MLPSIEVSTSLAPRRSGAGGFSGWAAVLALASLLLLPASHLLAQGHPWLGQEQDIELMLMFGKLVSKEPLGEGITKPYRVVLEHNGEHVRAIWKPLSRARHGQLESYAAEIAAYRLSRALGLDMVPPTVERRFGRQAGSLQLWLEDVVTYQAVRGDYAPEARWPLQIARMRFFDHLIDNPDRNTGNFLVDPEADRIYLIDHSRALNFGGRGRNRDKAPPLFVDQALVERLSALSESELQQILGDVFSKGDIRRVERLRSQMVVHIDELRARFGDSAFFVGDDNPRQLASAAADPP